PFTAVELITTTSSVFFLFFSINGMKSIAPRALAEAGKLRYLPRTSLGKVISPIHALAIFIPILLFTIIVPLCELRQPGWMLQYSLPTIGKLLGPEWVSSMGGEEQAKAALRITASVTLCCLTWVNMWIMRTFLGAQWAAIGVREKPTIVSTGPYGLVRHPLYSIMLAIEICFVIMFWSYVPLVAGAIVAICFAIKMPIEEELMEEDPTIGQLYKEYKKEVRARVIPLLW
ncbi:hypothetical protein BDV98DRAFT_512770, partial [Pterulicium gracile]